MTNNKNQDNEMPFVCPKTGKVIGGKKDVKRWKKWLIPFVGLVSLIWFLIRVIPKPSRAAYPCQRAAAPMAATFVTWLVGLAGPAFIFKKASRKVFQARYITAIALVLTGLAVTSMWTFHLLPVSSSAYTPPDRPNTPVGTAQGIHPGRVTYVRDAKAAKYNSSNPVGNWWDASNTDQNVINDMMTKSICSLTGDTIEKDAWNNIFKFFNQKKSGQNVGYQTGEKIVIKVNNNQDRFGNPWGTVHNNTSPWHVPTPQTLHALVDKLVHVVGVKGANITISDPSRHMGNPIVDIFRNDPDPEMKAVQFEAIGRTAPVPDRSKPIYFSGANIGTAYPSIATSQAKYIIDMALFRPHGEEGVTLCGKNFYGSICFSGNDFTPGNLHANDWAASYGRYTALVDLMGSNQLGGKTVLYMIDGIYNVRSNEVYTLEPYSSFGGWSSCIFTSQDPVAIDSVAFDFLANEPTVNINGRHNAPDNYLHEAAQANNPPSRAKYDPNRTGSFQSLGVHEHWNNATDKKYSRNLGTGNGIELVIPGQTPVPTPTPTSTRTPVPMPTPSKTPDETVQFKVDTVFSSNTLIPNQMITARVTATNTSGAPYTGTVDVLMIVALYDSNNTMVNISYISKGIPYRGTETLAGGFKLPSNVNGLKVKVFMWDGDSMKTTNMIPISNVTELP